MKHNFFLFILFISSFGFSQTILNENFSGQQFPPLGWQLQSVGTGNSTWFNFPNSTTGAVVYENYLIEQNERLITPSLNLSSYNAMYIYFRVQFQQSAMITDDISNFNVKVSTDNGVNWTTIWTDNDYNYSIRYNDVNLDISNYTGTGMNNVKIQFQFTSEQWDATDGSFAVLRNLSVGSCPVPALQSNDVQLIWSTPPSFTGTYDIEYGAPGFVQGTGTLVSGITSNNFTIPNINCNNINYFLRSNCGSVTSNWSLRHSRSAYTTPFVNNPNLDVTSNSIMLRYDGLAENFDIEYGVAGFTPGSGTLIENIPSVGYAQTYTISSLSSCTPYTFRIKASCNNNGEWLQSSPIVTKSLITTPYNIPFTETFNETICELGYTTNQAINIAGPAINNRLLVRRTNAFSQVDTRRFNVVAGQPLEISFDALGFNSNSNSTTLTLIDGIIGTNTTIGSVTGVISTTATTNKTFAITPNFTGEAFIRIVSAGNDIGLYIDNLKITNCTSQIMSTTVADNTINLNIINNSGVYDIAYGLSTQQFNNYTYLFGNASTSLSLTNLQTCSLYKVFVRSNCDGVPGNWIESTAQTIDFVNQPIQNVPYQETFTVTNPNTPLLLRACEIYWKFLPPGSGAISDLNYVQQYTASLEDKYLLSKKINLQANQQYQITYTYELFFAQSNQIELKFGVGLSQDVSSHNILKHYNPLNNTGIIFTPNFTTENLLFTPTTSGEYYFSFFVPANQAGNLLFYDNFTISPSLSVNSIERPAYLIYPNPSYADITIQNSNHTNEIFTFQIFDMIGRIVKIGNAFFDEKIEIESLHSGSYIIKITTENGEIQSQKFIKK